MGNIRIGDVVFGEDGKPCNVIGMSEVMYDHKLYELEFSDGSKIEADAGHLWVTETKSDRVSSYHLTDEFRENRRKNRQSRGKGKRPDLSLRNSTQNYNYKEPTIPTAKTTQEIVDTLTVENGRELNHAILVCSPIDLPAKELPVPPYVLGAWLGDGTATAGDITGLDTEVFSEIAKFYTVTEHKNKCTKGVLKLVQELRKINVFGNKHIPQAYLRASIEQRIELLQGLMDTDGYCDTRGQCEFCNTNKQLAYDVHELICSLGIKAVVRVGRATLYGKDCGEKYEIKFLTDIPVFKIQRKLERQKLNSFRGTHERRYIVRATEIPSQPVKCITVDSPSHLFLIGKTFIPTHNSHAVRAKATMLAYAYPGIKILIVRESVPMLRRNYINPMTLAYALLPETVRPRWADRDKAFVFDNNSTIELGYCSTEMDIAGYVGNEWDVLFLDEATQLSESQFYGLNSCVRGVNRYPKRTYFTCNPGGQGHDWVKRLFIDKIYREGERKSDYTFIQARVYDNIPLLEADSGFMQEFNRYKQRTKKRVLDEVAIRACINHSSYVQSLKIGSPEMVKAWLEGDWNIFSGRFFPEFHEKAHVLDVDESEVPKEWRRSAAVDYGLDCFAVLWFAEAPNGDVVCYRNYEQSNLIVERAAATFVEMSRNDNLEYTIAPPDLWNRRNDTGRSATDIFADYGVHFIKGSNSREQGWLNVKEYLSIENGKPRMKFLSKCKSIIKFMPLLQFDIKKPNDVDDDLNHDWSHSPAALRYWCSAWRSAPQGAVDLPRYAFKSEMPELTTDGYDVPDAFLLGGY